MNKSVIWQVGVGGAAGEKKQVADKIYMAPYLEAARSRRTATSEHVPYFMLLWKFDKPRFKRDFVLNCVNGLTLS